LLPDCRCAHGERESCGCRARLVAIFASFGLFAPHNSSVTIALFVAALSVAGSIYLMLEMDQPYSGPIKISSAPLRTALEQLGRP
jgi:hypothetical protein